MQEKDIVEILLKTKNFRAEIKSIARRKHQIDLELTEQKTYLEKENQNLIKINKKVAKFLYKHPTTTDELAERQRVILSKINREQFIDTQIEELGKIADEVKQATIQFTEELHEVVSSGDLKNECKGIDDEESSGEDEQPSEVSDDEESSEEEESVINLKRVREHNNNDEELINYDDSETEEKPIAKKIKPEKEIKNQTVHDNTSVKKRAGMKYCYKFLEFEGWEGIPIPRQVKEKFPLKRIESIGKSHSGNIRYFKCKTCSKNFSSLNVIDGKITIWSEFQGKLCACD